MDLKAILPPERIATLTKAGFWSEKVLLDYFDRAIAETPDRVAIVENNSETNTSLALAYRDLDMRVRRIAAGLLRLGVGKGDVVSYQLPNWWQFTALHLACLRVGAITNPLMPIFRERELRFMLGFAETKVMVVPKAFRGHDYQTMMQGLRSDLPLLRSVVAIGSGDADDFDAVLQVAGSEKGASLDAEMAKRRAQANDVVQIMYTSGTTGEPKGVMHTANTLLANVIPVTQRLGLDADSTVFCPTPNAHQLGFLFGVIMPVVLGAKVVLQDVWNAERAAQLIEEHHAAFATGATPFLADLTNLPTLPDYSMQSLRIFLSAGAPIPRALVQTASERLGAAIISAWGMTENGAVTNTKPSDPPEKVFNTDGTPLPGMEVRVVDTNDQPVPSGTEGRLQARGCSQFAGYLKRPELHGTSPEGWFETGDLARMDADGYIRISGRAKDIIIRGGENIPVVEVENCLFRHPAIQEVALVAMPDARLGERACAFIVTKPGAKLSLPEVTAFLSEQKMARQYHPEHIEIVEALPRTPSGKIQKFKLRDMAKEIKP